MMGPRIIFKDDRDSSVGRGCVLYAGHLRPEVIDIVRAAAATAPEGLDTVLVSEGWRDIRERRDLHEEGRAFDFSLNGIEGDEAHRREVGKKWATRMRAYLSRGSTGFFCDYQIIVHGSGSNLHIHAELDP